MKFLPLERQPWWNIMVEKHRRLLAGATHEELRGGPSVKVTRDEPGEVNKDA